MSRDPLSPPVEPLSVAAGRARNVTDLIATLWKRPAVRLAVYVVLVPLAIWLVLRGLQLLTSVLVTILLAYGLAFLCNPLLAWLEKRKVGRGVGVLLVLLLGVVLIGGIVMVLSSQLRDMLGRLPALADSLKNSVLGALDHLDRIKGAEGLKARISEAIDHQMQQVQEGAGPLAERLLTSGPDLMHTLSNLVGWLGQVGFIVTLAMYFMIDYDGVGRTMVRVFPKRWQPTLVRLADDVSESFGAYLRGTLLTMVACMVMATGGLMLLKVPNALAIGLLSGLINLFPYVGIVLASVLAMLQAIPQGSTTILLVALLYFLINQLLGNVIGPMIMGRTTQLTAATILVAILIGLALGGAAGALLAIPVATLIKRWLERYWLSSRAHEGRPGDAPPTVLGEPHLDPAEVMSDIQPDDPKEEVRGLSDGT
ncbi:AI-2E family transporter [Deinococcus hohokamensis]|uniref:AI-2E family transporter n=1 Tax=Deinococcus hohokamensis TaxID=309883 RepID=UPI0036D3AE3A